MLAISTIGQSIHIWPDIRPHTRQRGCKKAYTPGGFRVDGRRLPGGAKVHKNTQSQHAKCNHKHDNEGGNKLQSTTTNTNTMAARATAAIREKHTRTPRILHAGWGSQRERQTNDMCVVLLCVLWASSCSLCPGKTSAKHRLKVPQMGLGLGPSHESSCHGFFLPPPYLFAYILVRDLVCATSLWSATATDA